MSLVVDIMEPLLLADGTKIDPASGKVIRERKMQQAYVEIPSGSEAQAIVARTRRSVAELPLAPNNMNVLSLVLLYTMWGLQDQDIAITIGITNEQVKQIKSIEQYTKLSEDIRKSVLEHDATDIRQFFHNKARMAAEKIATLAEEEEGALGFAASKDILDRAGMRPNDVVEHRHSMQDALRIEFIKRDDAQNLPTIETSYKDVTNGDRS